MDTEELKEQLGKSKKLLILLAAVCLFGGFMWFKNQAPAESTEEESELQAQLDALAAERENAAPRPMFSGTDNRGISIGGGGGGPEGVGAVGGGAFSTQGPVLRGVLVGYGTKTDISREYLVAYVVTVDENNEQIGYEIDMREIVGYKTDIPTTWAENTIVTVFGEKIDDLLIKATAIQ